jgi:hypothetical protein
MEADQRHQFTDGDTVIICWTNILRQDRYEKDRGWITLGNIMNSTTYTKKFLTNSVCDRGQLIRDLAYIKAVKMLLENRPGVIWKFLSMCPLIQADQYSNQTLQYNDVINLYQDVLDSILPSFMEVLGDTFCQRNTVLNIFKTVLSNEIEADPHPNTKEHLTYLDTVLPNWVTNNNKFRVESAENGGYISNQSTGHCVQPRL